MCFFFSSRRRHTRWNCDWSSDVCSSDLDGGVVARVAGARGDPGTGVGAVLKTGGGLARRPEAGRVASDPEADVGLDSIQSEVKFDREVQPSRPDGRSEGSVLERSRGGRGARGSIEPAPGAEHPELEGEKGRRAETAAADQAGFPALALQLVVRLGTVQSEPSEGVEPADVW